MIKYAKKAMEHRIYKNEGVRDHKGASFNKLEAMGVQRQFRDLDDIHKDSKPHKGDENSSRGRVSRRNPLPGG